MNGNNAERTLWNYLAARGVVQGDYVRTLRTPWPIRLLTGAAGWLGALFCLLFVYGFVFAFARTSGMGMFAVGFVMLGVAVWFYATTPKDRTRVAAGQFALAFSLSGQGMMITGIGLMLGADMWKHGSLFWLIVAVLQAALFLVVPNRLHRFLMMLGTWVALAAAVAFGVGDLAGPRMMMLPVSVGVMSAAAMAAVAVFVRKEAALAASARHGRWAPAADATLLFGLGAALVVTGAAHPASILFGTGRPWPVPGGWAAGALLGVVLVAFAALECRRLACNARTEAAVLAVAVGFSVLMVYAPAVTAGVLALGYALRRGSLPWLGLAITALLLGFAWYYSTLQWTLLAKSITLVAAGALLLAAHAVSRRTFR